MWRGEAGTRSMQRLRSSVSISVPSGSGRESLAPKGFFSAWLPSGICQNGRPRSRTSDHRTSTRSPSRPRITKFGLRVGSFDRVRVGARWSRDVMEAVSSRRARGAPMQ